MRIKIVLRTLGGILKLLAILLMIPGGVSAFYGETNGVIAFCQTSLITMLFGIVLGRFGERGAIGKKEAFGAVSLGWILASFFGALPFAFMGLSLVNSLFESASGFSTSGATILTEFDAKGYYIINSTLASNSIATNLALKISAIIGRSNFTLHGIQNHTFYGLLFWRSFQQFIGGLGIILLLIAIVPKGIAGRQLYCAETIGPIKDTLVPTVRGTARILYKTYMTICFVEILVLFLVGMPLFDAICTGFSTVTIGGFSPRALNLIAYNNPLIEFFVSIFIIIGASSFIMHCRMRTSDMLTYFKDEEFGIFLLIIVLATSIIVFYGGMQGDLLTRFRFAAFQVISFAGTCGFVNTLEFDKWSAAAKLTLILAMLIGGCIGSAAGGIKIGRILICIKYIHKMLFHTLHPNVVSTIRLSNVPIRDDILKYMLVYTFFYLATWLILSLALTIVSANDARVDVLVATSGIASCMGGVGPGFGIISSDWQSISPAGRMIGYFAMLIGRLELMPIVLLYLPEQWRD